MASSQASASDKFVNTKSLEEEFLQCVICSEAFDQNTRTPKVLPCNHTFCLPCLKSVAKAQDERHVLKCPTCRQKHSLGPRGVKRLPADHKIIRMMDFLSVAGKESDNLCHQHRQQPLSFFCKNCEVPVCRDCTVVSHKEAKGHEVIEITEAIKEFTPQFVNTRDSTEEMSKKLQARSDLLNKAKEKLAQNQDKERRRIQREFVGYRSQLEKREKDLLYKLESDIEVDKTMITARGKEVDDQISAVKKLHEQYEEARKQQDVRQLFTLMHQMKEWEKSSTDFANGTDNDLQWYEYKPQNEDPFRKDVQELGNVEKMPNLLQQDFDTEIVCPSDSESPDDDELPRSSFRSCGSYRESVSPPSHFESYRGSVLVQPPRSHFVSRFRRCRIERESSPSQRYQSREDSEPTPIIPVTTRRSQPSQRPVMRRRIVDEELMAESDSSEDFP